MPLWEVSSSATSDSEGPVLRQTMFHPVPLDLDEVRARFEHVYNERPCEVGEFADDDTVWAPAKEWLLAADRMRKPDDPEPHGYYALWRSEPTRRDGIPLRS